MSKILKNWAVCVLIICMFYSCFFVSACSGKPKYTACEYIDVVYGDYERQRLDLYLPEEKSGSVGLILVIHGGAWMGGDKSYQKNMDYYCKYYGYATSAINYHFISDEFYCDDIMNDISLALAKIKEMAYIEKGLNIEKVLLMGNSAGGHLSLLYAYKYAEVAPIKPVAVANYSGPTDLTDNNYFNGENGGSYFDLFSKLVHADISLSNYLTADIQKKLLEYSPINYVTNNTVPTLICHAIEDDVVPYSNATTLKNRLKECGVKCDLVTYKNSGHSLGNDKKHKKEARKLFVEYAKKYLD